MADCSNTKTFLKEWYRCCTRNTCYDCPLKELCNEDLVFMVKHAETLAQKWSDEHPMKTGTYADDFFRKHPKAPRDSEGIPLVARCDVYGNCKWANCLHNQKSCWLEPYTEQEG